ncbi:50S ribosomal protein L13 [Candidatus Woesearchaeota archaeon]|nr:50S ribosomal protein L13 [Candidatus Woesearchaeota archaeon]
MTKMNAAKEQKEKKEKAKPTSTAVDGAPSQQRNSADGGMRNRAQPDLRRGEDAAASKAAVIDATNLILGRMAAQAAKRALNGEAISIINCEKAVVTGNRKQTIDGYAAKFEIGQVNQGPYFPRRPDMLVRRTIRGMLPRKKPKGRAAYERVQCFIGIPTSVKAENAKTIPEASAERIKKAPYITVNELCKHLGHKMQEAVVAKG